MKFLFVQEVDGEIREIVLEKEHTTIGRATDVDLQLDDQGLSRLNSTIYLDADTVRIVDNGSTNGTLVNDEPASADGTILDDGDVVKMGSSTVLKFKKVADEAPANADDHVQPDVSAAAFAPATAPVAVPPPAPTPLNYLPLAIIVGAIFVIGISAAVIAMTAFSGKGEVATTNPYTGDDPTSSSDRDGDPGSTPTSSPSIQGSSQTDTNTSSNSDLPTAQSTPVKPDLPAKQYSAMTDAEKRAYIEDRAMRVAQIIGNSTSEKIPPDAVTRIKSFVDAYVSRTKVKPLSGCRFGDNLQATYTRASKNAPFIIRAFNEKGMDPRIGLYLAMIESEHCTCLQSPTGPLGMFQFTQATGRLHGLNIIPGATPAHPDERCEPEPASRAAASYMKALAGRYGTGPSSIPLAIGSYNSGEGGLSSNLEKALSSGTGLPREFWTLIEKSDMLSKQFQSENFKYVPKFFAAAIIGENPRDFGLDLNPISTYTK
ncbi:MAG: transglycosylase SLT domain-containing protein [Pyrinomonadaceae bacterium]|nr:transglycosylase SLT domain-containing protein [Pyrinomonadaceae bacterium]